MIDIFYPALWHLTSGMSRPAFEQPKKGGSRIVVTTGVEETRPPPPRIYKTFENNAIN